MITLQNFFERAREGTLTGIQCRHCHELAMPPKDRCDRCHVRAWDPVTLSGDGTIESFRIMPDGLVGVVRLEEGVSLHGRIIDIPAENIAVGLPVRFRPLVTPDVTSVGFGPA